MSATTTKEHTALRPVASVGDRESHSPRGVGAGRSDRTGGLRLRQCAGLTRHLEYRSASAGPMPVLDLGCGVGGTLFYLAARMPIDGIGVTLSPVGVRLAQSLALENGTAGQCRFIEANYLALPDVGPRQAVYAIESFLHGPAPAQFFGSRGGRASSWGPPDYLRRFPDRSCGGKP